MYRAVRKTILCLRKLNIINNYLCLFVVGDEDRHSAKHSSNHHIGGPGAPAKPLPLPHHIRMNRRYVPYRMKKYVPNLMLGYDMRLIVAIKYGFLFQLKLIA